MLLDDGRHIVHAAVTDLLLKSLWETTYVLVKCFSKQTQKGSCYACPSERFHFWGIKRNDVPIGRFFLLTILPVFAWDITEVVVVSTKFKDFVVNLQGLVQLQSRRKGLKFWYLWLSPVTASRRRVIWFGIDVYRCVLSECVKHSGREI